MSHQDSEIREETLIHLVELYRDQSSTVQARIAQILLRSLNDENANVRRIAIIGPPGLNPPRSPAMVEALLLTVQDARVREESLMALREQSSNDPRILEVFIQALSDPVASTRETAARALTEMRPSDSRLHVALLQRLDDTSRDVRRASAIALVVSRNLSEPLIHELLEHLDDPDPMVRNGVARALAAFGPTDRISRRRIAAELQNQRDETKLELLFALDHDAPYDEVVDHFLATEPRYTNIGSRIESIRRRMLHSTSTATAPPSQPPPPSLPASIPTNLRSLTERLIERCRRVGRTNPR